MIGVIETLVIAVIAFWAGYMLGHTRGRRAALK
jgi:UPF0716 family protein affecting phage T7 exclusion